MWVRDHSFFRSFIPDEDVSAPLNREDLKSDEVKSVIKDVEKLLNTRSASSLSHCSNVQRRTVLDYGMPDFLHLSPLSRAAALELAKAVKDTIDAHEPRIVVNSVEVQLPRPCRDIFRVLIDGVVITIQGEAKPVIFPIDVQ